MRETSVYSVHVKKDTREGLNKLTRKQKHELQTQLARMINKFLKQADLNSRLMESLRDTLEQVIEPLPEPEPEPMPEPEPTPEPDPLPYNQGIKHLVFGGRYHVPPKK